MTAMRSQISKSSSSSSETTSTATPASRRSMQRLADLRSGADVHAPGRLRGDQHLRRLPDLAADDELLQVAAGQAARAASGPPALTLNAAIVVARELAHGVARG